MSHIGKRPRVRPIYFRRPPPTCPTHGVPMLVTQTREAVRYFRCVHLDCPHRAQQTRDKQRESYRA